MKKLVYIGKYIAGKLEIIYLDEEFKNKTKESK